MVRPVAPEFRAVEMLGWIDHDEAWEKGEPANYDPEKTRVIAQEQLLDPTSWFNGCYAGHDEPEGLRPAD